MIQIHQGNILRGSFWPEKVRVISAKTIGERQVKIETKLNELKKLMDAENLKNSGTKLLIFTESKDTLEYLVEKLRKWGYSVAFIHGGMSLDARIKAEAEFKNQAQIMVSTEAGGEGINLQFCWLMVIDKEIESIGMNIAMEYEVGQKRTPEDVSLQDLGYDIRSQGEVIRYIEVKARAKEGVVALTPNEWLMAQRLKEEYWLYVVVNVASDPELYLIQNPAAKLEPDKEIDIVRYVVRNWKDKAEAAK